MSFSCLSDALLLGYQCSSSLSCFFCSIFCKCLLLKPLFLCSWSFLFLCFRRRTDWFLTSLYNKRTILAIWSLPHCGNATFVAEMDLAQQEADTGINRIDECRRRQGEVHLWSRAAGLTLWHELVWLTTKFEVSKKKSLMIQVFNRFTCEASVLDFSQRVLSYWGQYIDSLLTMM